MAPPKSKIWQYFTKQSKEFARCNVCLKVLKSSGNTTNLSAHLKQKHAEMYSATVGTKEAQKLKEAIGSAPIEEKQTSVGQNVQIQEEPQPCSSKEKSPPSLRFPASPTSPSTALKSFTPSYTQPTISKTFTAVSSFSEGGSKNTKITNSIVMFICKDNQPFSIVEGKGFIQLMKDIAPLYKVPTRNTFKNLIDKKYDVMANSFRKTLELLKYVTLTTDIWTDMQTKSFMGVTVHYISNSKLVSATLGVMELQESHTAQYISEEFLKLLSEWGVSPDNVVAVVTDNGANIVKSVYDTFGKNRHVPCFAHTLNLVCENSIKNTEGLNELLTKVRAIVTWFKRSVHASDQLRKQQKVKGIPEGNLKKVILDVKTRWNSTFYMINRFVELAPLIANIVFDNVSAPEMLMAIEIEYLKEIIQLLRPLEKMTTEICGQKFITISKVIPMLRCVIAKFEKINPSSETGQKLRIALLSEFKKRFGQVEKSHLLACATILDPRFKQLHFKDPVACASVINILKGNVAKNSVSDKDSSNLSVRNDTDSDDGDDSDEPFDLWDYHNQLTHAKRKKADGGAEGEVTQYLQSEGVHLLSQDPLVIWEELKTFFPHLYLEAQKYLGIVATSVPCERLFSKAGATATKTRNRLTSKRLSKLLFLQSLPDEYWK